MVVTVDDEAVRPPERRSSSGPVPLLTTWPNTKILRSMRASRAFKPQAEILKALANESRLRIIDRLSRGEASVGRLTDIVGSDVSTVSKHLSVLRAHGIVDSRRDGNVMYYRLLTPCVCNFFTCAAQVFRERG